jgi:DNA modification methylase
MAKLNIKEDTAVDQTTAEKLISVSWDFKDSQSRNSLHAIHPYPAKFIPEIPRNLISLFHPGDNSAVLDPFCGSGTTLVEAKMAGLPAVGIDLHPLAALIAKVKITPLGIGIESIANDILNVSKEKIQKDQVLIPEIPNLDHWFKKPIQKALATLVLEIEKVSDPIAKDALKVAFSSIVVRVSNQESDTRYAAIEKNLTEIDVWANFERAVSYIGRVLGTQPELGLFPTDRPIQIINKDIMLVEPQDIIPSIGLVVTSPPYPNAYEYWLYHKYRMYWLGMNPIEVKEREIGARAHYFKKNHHTEHDFERHMTQCFWLLSKVLNQGGYACFVVGRSIIHGREIDNEAILERAASIHGFRLMGSADREIAASRKSFNLSHAKIKREGIVVFRLGDK